MAVLQVGPAPGSAPGRRPSPPCRTLASFDRALYKIGAVAGIVGSVAAFPLVVTHPHLPPGDVQGVLQTVLDFPAWLFIHMGLMLVLVVMLVALGAISRSVRSGRASAWALVAFVVAVIGTIVAVIGQGVDGVGFQVAADVWHGSHGTNKDSAVIMAAGVGGVATGVFVLVLFLYFGLTSLAYGLVFALSREYPKWLAALSFVGGGLGFTAALITYFDDFSDPVYFGLFIPSAVIFLLWVLAGSMVLWLRQIRHPIDSISREAT